MKIDKIITHDGLFHADEVFTVALLHKVFGFPQYVRTRKVTEEELANPHIWVLDQYNRYEPDLHNFDHHQDKSLSATNVLVLDYLKEQNLVSQDYYMLLRRPFGAISDYDRSGPVPFNGFQITEFIRAFNNVIDGFPAACDMAYEWLNAVEAMLDKKQKAIEIFNNGRSVHGIARICNAYPLLWMSMGTEKILVAEEKGQWRVHSVDTELYPIQSTGKEIFIHANKFISSYHNKQDAIDAALLTAKLI